MDRRDRRLPAFHSNAPEGVSWRERSIRDPSARPPFDVILSACTTGARSFVVHGFDHYGEELEESYGVKRQDFLQKMAHVAAMSGKATILSDVISLGAKVDKNILKASMKGDCADVFIILDHCDLDPVVRREWKNETLLRAIVKADITMMRLALGCGADPNSQHRRGGHRALALAVVLGRPETLACLLDKKVSIFNSGAIAAAVNYKNDDALADLLGCLPFINLRTAHAQYYQVSYEEAEELTSALIMAVIGMNKNAVKSLWRKGVDPFRENSRGLSAMKVAWTMQNPEMARFLADPTKLLI